MVNNINLKQSINLNQNWELHPRIPKSELRSPISPNDWPPVLGVTELPALDQELAMSRAPEVWPIMPMPGLWSNLVKPKNETFAPPNRSLSSGSPAPASLLKLASGQTR